MLTWVWVPFTAFVLVVAVAIACAVWSPFNQEVVSYGWWFRSNPYWLREIDHPSAYGSSQAGFGITFYNVWVDHPDDLLSWPDPYAYRVVVLRAGFPFRCLRWMDNLRGGSGQPSLWVRGIETKRAITVTGLPRRIPLTVVTGLPRRIPLTVEPLGMFLNILIASAAIVLARVGVRGAVVHRRRRKSLCVNCAYPVGDFAICPECGQPTGREP